MKIIIVGGFSEIIELCEDLECEIAGIIDHASVDRIFGYPVLGKDADAPELLGAYKDAFVVVSPDKPTLRHKLVAYYKETGFRIASLVSKRAVVSKYARLGEGVIIHNGVNVSAGVEIGNYVRLNVNSNVMHDCKVGDYSTVAPNAVLLGGVSVGTQVYVGANATLLPGVAVGADATIGAGAVVTKNVPASSIAKGVPAKHA